MLYQVPKIQKRILFIMVLLAIVLNTKAIPRDSLAPTPPMGFMTWNKYEENINEQLIRQIADKMATDGYARRRT